MLKNQLASLFRHFWRDRYYTLLNIVGLVVGIVSFLLISQYVRYERSYDVFHTNGEDIYRLQYNMVQNGITTVECAAAVPAAGPALKENYGQVKDFVRLYPLRTILSYNHPEKGKLDFREDKVQFTEPSLFDIFDFQLISGNASTALKGVNKIVLSERAVDKYFGDVAPMGEFITWNTWDGVQLLEVTGVMKNVPDNSHIKFDVLVSLDTYHALTNNGSDVSWTWYDFNTYILLNQGAKTDDFNDEWKEYLAEIRADHWQQYNYYQEFIFQPLKSIHLNSNLIQESEPQDQGDEQSVVFLFYAAILLLFITWVNYVNISSVRLLDSAGDIGMRKVLGAENKSLYARVWLESFLLQLLAIVLSMIIIFLVWEDFGQLIDKQLPKDYLTGLPFIGQLVLLALGGATLCSAYPILILSKIKPADTVKGKLNMVMAQGVRKGFLFFQFTLATIILIVAYVSYQQYQFMRHKELGVTLENVVVLQGPEVIDTLYDSKIESFRTEIKKLTGVKSFTTSSTIPGERIFWTRGIRRVDVSDKNNISVYNVGIDADYVSTYGLKVIAGRNFVSGSEADYEAIIINRKLSDQLDFDSPEEAIGTNIRLGRDTIPIIGVIENYHQLAITNDIAPISFLLTEDLTYYSLGVELVDNSEMLTQVEQLYTEFFPGNPFNYFFLDDHYNKQYSQTERFIEVFGLFSLFAILACYLGLAGLVSYATTRRTKEIGIRKALGTSNFSLILLFASSFLWILLPSSVVGWLVSWYTVDAWLNSFPYRISLHPLYFIFISGFIAVFVFFAVMLNTLKTSRIKPAEALRYE